MRWYVAPLVGGAVVIVVAVTSLGWWRPVLFEKERAPRWLISSPIFMVLGATLMLTTKNYASTTATMVLLLVVGSLVVGIVAVVHVRGRRLGNLGVSSERDTASA